MTLIAIYEKIKTNRKTETGKQQTKDEHCQKFSFVRRCCLDFTV